MKAVCRFALAALLSSLAATTALGGQATPPKDPQAAKPAAPKPEQKPDQKPEQKPEDQQKYEETVIVSASRTEEKLINAPATMIRCPCR